MFEIDTDPHCIPSDHYIPSDVFKYLKSLFFFWLVNTVLHLVIMYNPYDKWDLQYVLVQFLLYVL